MGVSVLNHFVCIPTLVSLSLEKDGAAATGHLLQMVSLAVKDPEGCVRSEPLIDMDAEAFSRYFNCDLESLLRSVEVLCKHSLVEVEDGRLYVSPLRKKKKAEAVTAARRARHAQEVREWRSQQKTAKKTAVTDRHTVEEAAVPSAAVTDAVKETMKEPVNPTVMEPAKTPMGKPWAKSAKPHAAAGDKCGENRVCDPVCDYDVNLPATDRYISDISNTSDISKKEIYHISSDGKKENAKPKGRTAGAACTAAAGKVSAGATGKAGTGKGIIPLDELPDDLRQVVEAWNGLHRKTFTGLTAAMRNKLQELLQQYPLADVLRAIGTIACTPFLLGQTEASRNFRITLGWVLKPENCGKVLSGQYETFPAGDGENTAGLSAASCGYGAPREWCETYLPDHASMTPEERKAAFHDWMNPHNEDLDEAAAIMNVTY